MLFYDIVKHIDLNTSAAVLSLIIASLALYKTVLKKGKFEIVVYQNTSDIKFHKASTVKGINDFFILNIPVIFKNLGAGPIAVKEIVWKIDSPDFLESQISSRPTLGNIDGLFVLKPYEQVISFFQINIGVKGRGQGFSQRFFELLESIPNKMKNEKYIVQVGYDYCSDKRIIQINKEYNFSKVIFDFLTTEQK